MPTIWNNYRMWRAKEVGWLLRHNDVKIIYDGSFEPSDMTFSARTLKEPYRKAHKYFDVAESLHPHFIMVIDWEDAK